MFRLFVFNFRFHIYLNAKTNKLQTYPALNQGFHSLIESMSDLLNGDSK
jgi:hypothetical protein